MKRLFWEQQSWSCEVDDGTTPLDILQQIGKEGRAAFIEILAINYRDELEEQIKAIRNFEKKNF